MGAIGRTLAGLVIGGVALISGEAQAGMPECGNIRIEPGAQCQIEQGGECSTTCDQGVYAQACSTQQYEHCRGACTLPPDPACASECAASCDERCAAGIEIVCHDNCFPECVDTCAASCDTATDTVQCRASCEATCDGECAHQCEMLPEDATCVTHCIECCGGACGAAANMGCQMQCQGETWADCENQLRSSCESSCAGEDEGALFCDGQLVASGAELAACAEALVEEGVGVDGLAEIHAYDNCACRSYPDPRSGWGAVGLGLLGLLGLRRRRG